MNLFRASLVVLFAALCLANVPPAARAVQADYGQITMENQTSATLDLYVDGEYAGRALNGLFCTTQVTAGAHSVEAKATDGRSVSAEVTVDAGGTFTWTIRED